MTALLNLCLAPRLVSSGATWRCHLTAGHDGPHDDGTRNPDSAWSEADDDPDDFQRGCYGADMVNWQPQPPARAEAAEHDRTDPAAALRAVYWMLRGHASNYRDTEIFKRRQEEFRARPNDVLLARGALRDEWYARGIESAADDIAEIITLDYEADVEAETSAPDDRAARDRAIELLVGTAFAWAQEYGYTDPNDAKAVWAAARLLRPDMEPLQ